MALINFSTVRKNMQLQSEQQIRNLRVQSEPNFEFRKKMRGDNNYYN
jgi:hypothetical protein